MQYEIKSSQQYYYLLSNKDFALNFICTKMMKASQSPDKTKKQEVNIDSFYLHTVIGKGSYAKVVLVKKKDTGDIFAMKILKKKHIERRKQEEHVLTERNVLVGINHPFIINLYYSFQNERKLFFVLEYCPGGELFNLLQKRKQFTEEQYFLFPKRLLLTRQD